MSAKTVRFAIIGSTGAIGSTQISAISHVDCAQLVGIHARTKSELFSKAKMLGVKPFVDLDSLLADKDVDAVIISTPHPSHEFLATKVAESGKHVLTEKPMGVTPKSAKKMIDAAKFSNVKLGVLFMMRFQHAYQKAKEILDSGTIGDLYLAQLNWTCIRTQDYFDRTDWRGKWSHEGGAVLLNQAIHGLDLLHWFTGSPNSIVASALTRMHTIEAEDYVSAILDYDFGHGIVHLSTIQAPPQSRIELWGDKGGIVIDKGELSLYRLKKSINEFILEDSRNLGGRDFPSIDYEIDRMNFDSIPNLHVPAIEDFAKAILEDRSPFVSGEDGIGSQHLAASMLLSSCANKRVHFPVDDLEYQKLLDHLIDKGELTNF